MKKGLQNIKRVHAKNYTQKYAQKRLKETQDAFDRQTENALFVNKTDIIYFKQAISGIACSCQSIPEVAEYNSLEGNTAPSIHPTQKENGNSPEVTIKLKKSPLFGESESDRTIDISSDFDINVNQLKETAGGIQEDDLFAIDDNNVSFSSNPLAGHNTDCGICYRTGIFPGYSPLGIMRQVFTSTNMSDSYRYNINTTIQPNTLESQHPEGYVEFNILVPKYFKSVEFSVRNNNIILIDKLYTNTGDKVTLNLFRQNAGHTIQVRVKAKVFTHIVLDFVLQQSLYMNISTDSKTLDYNLMNNLSNFQVVLPNKINVEVQDIIVVKKRNLTLKVTDVTAKKTADGRIFGWEASTRVLQPSESLNNIYKSYKIL